MITPITATFPALNFPKESDYPTQNDWAAFSAAAELNYGILSGEWSLKSELYKNQMNTLAFQIQQIGENAINAITFNDIATLKLNSNMGRVDVLGYYTKGDGGGGTFYWDSTSTEADNGGTIIQATGVTTGRWKRVFSGNVNVKWFGAKGDGITDDYTSIQNAINSFTTEGILEFTRATYKVNSTLLWKYSKCNIIGNGCSLDFSSLATTYAINFERDVDSLQRRYWTETKFIGNSTLHCMQLEGSVSGHLANINFEGITIYQFNRQLEIGRSCSNIHFKNSLFVCDGANYRQSTAIYLTANANFNTGEQISFSGCQLGAHKRVIDNRESGCNGEINFNQCSLVYFDSCFYNSKGLRISANQCSIESNIHTNYWFECLSNNSHISIRDTEFVFTGVGGVTKEIFNILPNSYYNGLYIDNCTYTSTGLNIPFWSTLTDGVIKVKNWRHGNAEAKIPFSCSIFMNQLAYKTNDSLILPTFIPYSDNLGVASITSEETYNGNVVKLATAGNGNIKFNQTIPIEGGTDLVGSFIIKTVGVTSMGIYVSLLDADKNVIYTATIYEGGNIAAWTVKNINWTPLTQMGAKYIKFNYYSGSTGNIQKIYLSTICINCL